MISGSGEYKSEPSLKAFAELLKNHYGARCTLSLGKDGIAAAAGACRNSFLTAAWGAVQ